VKEGKSKRTGGVLVRFVPVFVAALTAYSLAFPAAACADPIAYGISGRGGVSGPQAGVSDRQFAWIDSTGNVPGTTVAGTRFYPLPDLPFLFAPEVARGSLLKSSSFTIQDGDVLSLTMGLVTGDDPRLFAAFDVGFALLLESGTVRAVLANLRPNGRDSVGDQVPAPPSRLVPVTPGVEMTSTTGGALPLTLGGTTYGQASAFGDCFGACNTFLTSTFTPGAGTYQLLFGIFTLTNDPAPPGDPGRPSALMVTSVNVRGVPEPATLAMLGLGLTMGAFVRRRLLR
jgi:hypothetical protein